uniref:Integrase, catalytic region, zinc finger, CCHC-type, peptidase aspartic, catalytic n=1 Tax=Tanacetum cinerariifolium TaxID=118510 RepID=A0A6L2M484_TANCI|nr:hypothetical protein [Tanacetum cinerariifolium]
MLNKDKYVSWSSRIIRYARSRPNGKMIIESIENGPYIRRMIATPGEPDLHVLVPESFHEQTDEELTENDIKQMDAYDQAIQTILLGLLEDVYAAVDSCGKAKEIWERVRQMMNKYFPENIAVNLKFLNNLQPEWKRHVTIVCQTKNLHEADFTQIYDFLKMNQDENQQRYNAWQNGRIQVAQNTIQNAVVQNDGNQNGLVVVPGIANQNGTGNFIAARAEGIQLQAEEFNFMATAGDLDEIEEVNANCILMENLQHASTFGTQLDKAPVYDTNGSAKVQLNDNCYDNKIFNMFTQEEQYTDLIEPIPEPQLVPQNDNHVTSVALSMVQSGGTLETSSAPNKETRAHQETVYRNLIDQVAHVNMVNCNMRVTSAELKSELARYKIQEQRIEISQEKYEKLEKCYQKSVYQEQCLTRKINPLHLSSAKQITTLNDKISNLNKQLSKEKSTISSLMEEKKKLKHDFKTQEDRYLDKEVDLKAKIKYLENILLKRDQTFQTMHMLNLKPDSFYHPDQKIALGYPDPSYLKKAQLKQQSLYTGNMLLEEHYPPAVYDSEETLELAQESREKFLKKEIKPANYAKINHLSGVFVPQMTKSKEELCLSNISNMVTVSKMISIPNEDLSDDTTPSVARKFLNELKNSFVTLQCVVKQKMTLEVHNWSSSAHKEVYKLISHEIALIINQVDARVQNFEIQFLQEAVKFVRDFKSLAKEADESLDKQKSLELKIKRLLKVSVSHDIMFIVQNGFVDVPSDLQTELDRMKEKLEHCILKKEKEYAVLWNNCNVIAPGMFKIDPSQTSRVDLVPNDQSSASSRTNPITNFQRHVTFKENVSSDTVNASSTGLVHTARTKRPQPKGNTRNARVPSAASKSSEVKKNVTVEDHRRILLLSKNQKTMSSECNNIKLVIWNDKSKIICGTGKQCLVTANHDACLLSSVNALNSRENNMCANVPLSAN